MKESHGDVDDSVDEARAKLIVTDVEWALTLLKGPLNYDNVNDAVMTLERARWRLEGAVRGG